MEIVKTFLEFLKNIGAPHFLTIGIIIIVLWLLISGIRKGIKGRRKNEDPDQEDKN